MVSNWTIVKCKKCGKEYRIQDLHICRKESKEVEDLFGILFKDKKHGK